MKIGHISRTGSRKLILIFAGWGMDTHPFAGLKAGGYDIAVAFDYRQPDEEETPEALREYEEICLIAWSFGVIAAANFIESHPRLPITARIAVNGTLCPVDDRRGIPEKIFRGTLESLSDTTLRKFNRRMCGSSEAFAAYSRQHPQRTIDDLREELAAIALRSHRSDLARLWDTVFVSDADMIIPTSAQMAAWDGHPDLRIVAGAHLPDFRSILSSAIVNKSLVAARFSESAVSYDCEASVQSHIARRVAEMAKNRATENDAVLEIGAGTGLLTRELARSTDADNLTLWDIATIPADLPGHHEKCDAETRINTAADESVGLITSASALQWFNSPATFIARCRRVLAAGGTFAASTFGEKNFHELTPYLPATLHYYSAAQWKEILRSQGWGDIEVEEEEITLRFDGPAELLRHISRTGVNALGRSTKAAREIIRAGVSTLTYHPVYIRMKK